MEDVRVGGGAIKIGLGWGRAAAGTRMRREDGLLLLLLLLLLSVELGMRLGVEEHLLVCPLCKMLVRVVVWACGRWWVRLRKVGRVRGVKSRCLRRRLPRRGSEWLLLLLLLLLHWGG